MADNEFSLPTESIEIARSYAGLLGAVPANFSISIRSMISDLAAGTISQVTKTRSWLVVRSPSIQSFAYYALQTAYGKDGTPAKEDIEKKLYELHPLDLASLITTILFVRRVKKSLEKLPEDFRLLMENWQRTVDLGLVIGGAIPAVGIGIGLIAGSLPAIGAAAIMLHDPKGAREYRRFLKQKDLWVNFPYELQRWNCTAVQVGAAAYQEAALGMDIPAAISQGFLGVKFSGQELFAPIHKSTKYTRTWIETLRITGKGVTSVDDVNYLPLRERAAVFEKQINYLKTNPTINNCLSKTKEDLFPAQAPTADEVDKIVEDE